MLLVVGSRWDLRWWYGNHCVGDSSSFGDYVVYFVFRLIDSEVPLSLERSSERQLPVPLATYRYALKKCSVCTYDVRTSMHAATRTRRGVLYLGADHGWMGWHGMAWVMV